jgi:hypothetical protein
LPRSGASRCAALSGKPVILGLVVTGDVAYNHCHMYVGASTADSRAEWIAALDKLAALHPAR